MLAFSTILEGRALDYGHDAKGGFYVIDHDKRWAAYAYPTSPNAVSARKVPRAIVLDMAGEQRNSVPADIQEQHYLAVCKNANR